MRYSILNFDVMDLDEQPIPAPPECTYRSYDEAYNALKSHGLQNSYGFRLKGSRPYGLKPKTRYYYCCDKAGIYLSQATTKKTRLRVEGCLFSLVIF